MTTLEKTLYDGAQYQYEEIADMDLGSDQYTKTVNGANNMMDRLNEAEKIKLEKRRLDIEEQKAIIEKQRVENENKIAKIKVAVGVATFVAAAAIEVWAHIDSKLFEMDYTKTTESGKSSTRKLLSFMDKVKMQ